MNEFIKSQQELARKVNEVYKQMAGDVLMGGIPDVVLDTLITQIIQNTGEEILWKCNKEIKKADNFVPFQAIHYKSGIDTIKQHITRLTGVE